MTAFGSIIAICLVGGALLGMTCRFIVLIPGIALAWLCIGLEASVSSWSALATVLASSAATLQTGYLAGAAMAEFIPLRIRRLIVPRRAEQTSKPI